MPQPTPLYIIASPRPRVGKTLIARLLIEFLRYTGRLFVAYDLNPREPALAGYFPELAHAVDIADTRGQMALFDDLIANPDVTAIIDLGHETFGQFFKVMGEIGFAQEAQRRGLDPVVIYVVDRALATARNYTQLQNQPAAPTLVPAHNEAVSSTFVSELFPPTRAECRQIRIPVLSPIVRGIIDRPRFSFGDYLADRPGGPTEIDNWIGTIFSEFCELELRLLMGRLSAALGRTGV